MNRKSAALSYNKLLEEISSLYERARSGIVAMYWNIGKHIVEVELKNNPKGEYGDYLIDKLSKDLTEKYGKGFSKTNLNNMRNFYSVYSIDQLSGRLDWSSYVTLLSISDDKEREKLEKRAIEENINYIELRKIAGRINKEKRITPSHQVSLPDPERGLLYRYSPVDPARAGTSGEGLLIDCGFNIWKGLEVKNIDEFRDAEILVSRKKGDSFHLSPDTGSGRSSLYTYRARVERVVDGDTLWVVVHCGFNSFTRQKLRLRGIDTPELGSPEGEKSKRFVEKRLKGLPFVVIKTYKSDKYDRYLTDLFFLPGVHDPERVAAEGRFLNREVVEKGGGVVV
jgi:endonuclease YncB( thermonuclease family)